MNGKRDLDVSVREKIFLRIFKISKNMTFTFFETVCQKVVKSR